MRVPRRAARRLSAPASSGLSASSTCATATGPSTTVGLARLGGLRRTLVEAVLGAGHQRGEIQPGPAGRGRQRTPGGMDLRGDERALLERGDAAGRGDRDARGPGAQLDRQAVAGDVGELLRQRDRVEREHGRVPAVVRPALGRVGKAARVDGLAVECRVRARGGGRAFQALGGQVGGGRRADAAVPQHDELGGVLDEVGDAVLPDGEPPLPPHGRLSFAAELGERLLGEGGEVALRGRHGGAGGYCGVEAGDARQRQAVALPTAPSDVDGACRR